MRHKHKGSTADILAPLLIFAAVIGLALFLSTFVTVDEGDRAVVTTFGEISGEM